MPLRLAVAQLASSAAPPLTERPQFSSELLRSPAKVWVMDVLYLRDAYQTIYELWDKMHQPQEDEALYRGTEPHLRELLLGLEEVARQVSSRPDVYRDVLNAGHDADVAATYAGSGNWALATIYASYSLMKLRRVLDSLTAQANRKRAYGLNIDGEIGEAGGTSGEDNHLWDTAQPQDKHHTPQSPSGFDAEAEKDFPQLAELKHKTIEWGPRN